MKRAKIFLVWLVVLNLLAPAGFSFAQVFEDSNVFTLKTESGGPVFPTLYSLFCNRTQDTEISVTWSGDGPKPHNVSLFGAEGAASLALVDNQVFPKAAVGPDGNGRYSAAGNYRHQNVNANSIYHYQLKVTYNDGSPEEWLPAKPIDCSPGTFSSVAGNLNVWALKENSLFVNWKDNEVKPHTFVLERIKLTPNQPFFAVASNAPDKDLVRTVDSNTIHLNWQNDTNVTAESCAGGTTNGVCKGPFYHSFDRVYFSGLGNDPKTSDPKVDPFVDRNNDGRFDLNDDPTFLAVKKAFQEDVNHQSVGREFYGTDDTNLQEGTEYYYRLKACSFIKADLTKETPGVDGPYEDVCSKYATLPAFVATTTFPATPSGPRFTDVTKDSITFEWTDRSNREDGYEITVSPQASCPNGGRCTGNKIYFDGALNGTKSVTLNNLQYGTVYDISIKAYRNSRLKPGETVLSKPASGSRQTFTRLVTYGRNGGINPVPPAPADYFYPYNFRTYVSAGNDPAIIGNPVEITATGPDDVELFSFDRLQGCNVAAGIPSCQVTMSDNRDVTAVYVPIAYRVTTFDNCVTPHTNSSQVTACDQVDRITCPTPNSTPTCKVYVSCTGTTSCGSNIIITKNPPTAQNDYQLRERYTTVPLSIQNMVEKVVRGFSFFKLDGIKRAARRSQSSWPNFLTALAMRFQDYFVALIGGVEKAAAITREPAIGDIGLTDVQVDNYFGQFVVDGRVAPAAMKQKLDISTFENTGLGAGIVYMYRVRACYADSNQGCASWSNEAAGKTLPNSATKSSEKIGICVRNNLCELRDKYTSNSPPAFSESQCQVNANCQDVGTSRQFFEEVKPR